MENNKFAELDEILEDISDIFDMAYKYTNYDEEEGKHIKETEDRLHKFLHEAGLIREDAWMKVAKYCEKTYGTYADFDEGYFICPECDEPVYKCDWEDSDFHICPVCEFNFYEG